MREDNGKLYSIPNNFIESGRWLNGMLRIRFSVECAIIFILIFFPACALISGEGSSKFGLCLGLALPPAAIALVGINEDSLLQTIGAARAWLKTKQIMLYKDDTQTYSARPIDVMLNETNATDVIVSAYADWANKRAQQKSMLELVEGVDFEFMQDNEYDRMVPKERKKAMRRKAREDAKLRKEEERQRKQHEKMANKHADSTSESPIKSDTASETDSADQTAVSDTNQQTSSDGSNMAFPKKQKNEDIVGPRQKALTGNIPDRHEDDNVSNEDDAAPTDTETFSSTSDDGETTPEAPDGDRDPDDTGFEDIAFETEETPIVAAGDDADGAASDGMEQFVVSDDEGTTTAASETPTVPQGTTGTKRKRSRSRRRKRPPQNDSGT